ncbi:nickel/cobalt transporter [Elusimicrobiota bacterium]
MKRIIKTVILLMLLCNIAGIIAAENPLISGKKKKHAVKYPAIVRYFISKITPVQYSLRNNITDLVNNLKEKKSSKTLLILIGIAFMYGLIHALGPGHGKVITFSYFLSKKSGIRKGVLLGNLIAFLQVSSAIVIIAVIYFIIKKAFLTTFEDMRRIIQLMSYALISLMGVFLFFRMLYNQKKESEKNFNGNDINIIPIAVSIGVVPCPAAVIILLFSISVDMIMTGVVLSLFMAAGMAFTISFVGISTIFMRNNIENIFPKNDNVSKNIHMYAGLFGSFLIFLLGTVLFAINL